MKIKTIDIIAREWFDRVNGNSYFSAQITLNYGMKDATLIKVPFQYGYGTHYETVCKSTLIKKGYLKPVSVPHKDSIFKQEIPNSLMRISWDCMKHNIILRSSKVENCLKVDVKRFGGES